MKRGVRIWEEPLEIFDGVLGSNLAALGSRCWAFRFGHVKNSFPFLETGFGHFLWILNTQFSLSMRSRFMCLMLSHCFEKLYDKIKQDDRLFKNKYISFLKVQHAVSSNRHN
jgi:hypothetical protein